MIIVVYFAWWYLGSPNMLRHLGLTTEWPKTDFTISAVDEAEIFSAGPPRDGIPSIDDPEFLPSSDSISWLNDDEPVIAIIHQNHAKAYPIQILIWHEIVNDVIGDIPVSVTFCPLCNASIVFDRRIENQVLDFGTTGRLRKSDMIMYDRQTESWWQQFTGTAIVGTLTGTVLKTIPSRILSWGDFKEAWPDGSVLSRDTGLRRDYGSNPYQGYDTIDQRPFFLSEDPDPRLLPKDRVATIQLSEGHKAYPYSILEKLGVINDFVDDQRVVVFSLRNTRSALDKKEIATSRMVLSAQVFLAEVNKQELTFYQNTKGDIIDHETGSHWLISGQAMSGPLKGSWLQSVSTETHFAFAWLAFRPSTQIYTTQLDSENQPSE